MNRFLRNIILLLCLSFCSNSIAQSPSFKHYTVNEGLAHNRCYMITQDNAGFLYFATENGLSRFDGFNFKTFTDTIMQDVDVLKCKIGPNDKVWFLNLTGELFYLENEVIYRFNPDSLLSETFVLDFYFFDNKIYIINDLNTVDIFSQEYEFIRKITFENPLYGITSANKIEEDKIYFTKKPGVFKYDFKNENIINISSSLNTVFKIDKIFNNTLFLYSRIHNTTYVLEDDTLREVVLEKIANSQKKIISTALIDEQLWVATSNGCYIYDKQYQFLDKKTILEGYYITDVFKDIEGNYWISTHGKGVFRIINNAIANYNIKNSSLVSNNIYSFSVNSDTSLLLGFENGNIQALKNSILGKHKQVKKDFERILYTTTIDNEKILIGGDGPAKIVDSKSFDSIKNKFKYYLFRDSIISSSQDDRILRDVKSTITVEDEIWFGTNLLVCYSNLKFDNLYCDAQLRLRINDFMTYNDTIFVATDAGLYISNRDTIYYKYKNFNKHISALEKDDCGNLFVGTKGAGLFKISNGIVTNYNQQNGLSSNNIKVLTYSDKCNSVWIGTNNGLYEFNNEKIKLYDISDGLISNQINDIIYLNNKLYIGTDQGLSVLNTNIADTAATAPNLYFTSIQISDNDTSLYSNYTLEHNQNNIRIFFNAISCKNQKDIKYKYRMNGIDQSWVYSEINQASYPILPYGDYLFEAKAINKEGNETKESIKIEFEIIPPFWHTWWFRLIAFSLVGLGIYFFIKYRIAQINKNTRLKEQVDREMSELKLQTLHAQMNPHFIFNSMNAIQNFISSNQQQLALNYLSKLSRLIRTIFEFSKRQTITLEEEIEFLKNYINLEEMRFTGKAKGIIEVDEKIDFDDIEITPMLIQPIVENSFKHGLFHKNDNGWVKINFTKTKKGLKIIVEDNGIGRAATKLIQNNKLTENHKSSGLDITRERLKTLKNVLIESSSLDIVDLFNDNNEAIGTKVNLHLNYIH